MGVSVVNWEAIGVYALVLKRTMTIAGAKVVRMITNWFGSEIKFEGTQIKETVMKIVFVAAHMLKWMTTACCILFFNLGEIPSFTPRNLRLKNSSKGISPFRKNFKLVALI